MFRRSNDNYCDTIDEIISNLTPKSSEDLMKKNKLLLINLETMKFQGYVKVMPFVKELSSNGFKHGFISKFILNFVEELERNQFHVNSINTRVVTRCSNFDKNIFLNRLIFEFEDQFMTFLDNYDELEESKTLILSSFEDLIEQGKANKINSDDNIEDDSLDENDFDQFLEMI